MNQQLRRLIRQTLAAVAPLMALLAPNAHAGESGDARYPERWLYRSFNLQVDRSVDDVRALFDRAARAGYPATELLGILNAFRPQHSSAAAGWPKSPWALSTMLRRLAGQLRATGIECATARSRSERVITIARAEAESPFE